MLHIIPIPAFNDNYIWLLHNKRDVVLVDPGDAAPVLAKLKVLNLTLDSILITHHHSDHIGGVETLLAENDATVYAPKYGTYPFKHNTVEEGDSVHLASLGISFNVMWLPGHTLDHIAYFNDEHLFCGDVLFGAGCGRLFEGTPAQMLHSLNRLKQLNPKTNVYCAHEYTEKNINFALSLEPKNQDLLNRQLEVKGLRQQNLATLPSSIGLELKTNPFLRCEVLKLQNQNHAENADELSIFTTIRAQRNHY